MIEKVIGCALEGIEAQKVEVEVNVSRGAKFLMVGLPDNAVKESESLCLFFFSFDDVDVSVIEA